jgi:patatin-like phospholipase/acyl hydrolase
MSGLTKVLSIDGGGIRGVIPGTIMAEIERRTGEPIFNLFDLIAGTSTGGILALGLTKPDPQNLKKNEYSAGDAVKMYEDKGDEIFSRSVWYRLHSRFGLTDEKYPTKGIETVLDEYFGGARLKDALTNVLITSYEIERRFPFFFRSSRAKNDPTYDFPTAKVARATSAAPTYFEPLKLETEDSADYYALVDGGVYANNPAMCAYVEALTLNQPPNNDILVVSLGTGQLTRPLPFDQAKDWGLIQWAQPILNVVFDGVSDTVEYQLKNLLPEDRYYRFQTTLDVGNDDMDDASRTNIRVLKLKAEELIHERESDIDALCRLLKP